MGWREAPDHAESILDAARRRLPRLLNHQNFSQLERGVWDISSIGAGSGHVRFISTIVALVS